MIFSSHRTRKRFGQHWLKDDSILEKIIKAADLNPEDRILEVGPGKGALTKKLLDSKVSHVHSIEVDRDLVIGLKERFGSEERFSLQQGDILSSPLKWSNGISANKVVANIPYNITGPLLKKLIGSLERPAEVQYKSLVLLMQKEVAQRIVALPGNSNFSALSVRIQLLARCKLICDVSPKCFQPPPKVQSTVIRLEPFLAENYFDSQIGKRLESLLKKAFSGSRKKLRNTIGSYVKPLISIESLGLLSKTIYGLSLSEDFLLSLMLLN